MPRSQLFRRVGIVILAVLLVVAVVVGGLGVKLVRQSFPQTTGEAALPGLTGDVSVQRDSRGVPQIYADTADDLFRAQGYVAAQDRFFEMDLRRHITAGRLAELVGADGLATDRVIRTMGWRRVAEAELPKLAPATQRYLRAYADGVNAYLSEAGSPSHLSLEYAVLGQKVPGYRVEPWSPVDSLAWLKAMAWDLRSNYADELTRARLAGTMSIAHSSALYPPYDAADRQPILSQADWQPPAETAASADTGAKTAAAPAAPAASVAPVAPLAQPAAVRRPVTLLASDGMAAVTSGAADTAYAGVSRALHAVPVMLGRGDGIGSNAWAVSGEHSTTGKPLLANDPHLGVSMPGIWYQTGLHCRKLSAQCPFDVAGYSFAGLPGIVIGHNNKIAWGFTNLGPDVSDFYLEQVVGQTYLRDGAYVPLKERTETIKVAGAPDQQVVVRESVHGPLLSDVIDSVNQAGNSAPVDGKRDSARYDVSLAWTGLEANQTADAIFGLNSAQDWTQFRAAARDFAVPAQNLVYADTAGHIGYQAPGRIPIRRSATKGAPPGYWPAPGWNSAYDWTGYVPFEQMPTSLDPKEGLIVTANQEVTTSRRPFLTTDWDPGYRSQRIRELLQKSPKISPEQMSQIQGDTRNGLAPVLVKALLAIDLGSDEFSADGQKLLRGWDFTTPTGPGPQAAAAAYYNAVWSRLMELTFDDELPEDLRADGGSRYWAAVAQLLKKPQDPWWDNKQTPGVTEGRDEILRQALVDARLDLTRTLGRDTSTWQWGRMHQLELKNQVLGGDGVPGIVQMLFNRGPWEMPGGSSIVDANGWDASMGYDVNWAPSMRMIVDLGNLDASRWVNQSGNSGHAYSDHYVDQVDAWRANQTFPWPSSVEAVRKATEDVLTLKPSIKE